MNQPDNETMKLVREILLHPAPDPQAHLWPCLVGKTGAGKTARAWQLATDLNLKLVHLTLGGRLPEDINGLPRLRRDGTEWTLPDWFRQAAAEPALLFIDEADKAPRECRDLVLTLLAEKRLREHTLHPDTRILLAMQPVPRAEFLADETGEALAARLLFIPIPYDWDYIGAEFGMDLSGLPSPEQPELPLLPTPSPRQIKWALSWINAHPQDWAVLEYFLTAETIDYLREAHAKVPLSGKDLALAINDDPARLEALTIPELISLSPDVFEHCHSATMARMLVRVWTEGNEDDAAACLRRMYETLRERALANGNSIEVAAGDDEDTFLEHYDKALRTIADCWIRRAKEKKKK